jgi:tetratricopeptide (TPR) repeat protein
LRSSVLIGAAALALAAPASAAWQQASSKHFVIYGDMTPEEMKAYATKLETFDAASRLIRSMKDPSLGDGNRLQVFVVSDLTAVGRLVGSNDYGIAGYFMGPVDGPVAVVPEKVRQKRFGEAKMTGEQVFFHEYTHSLQLQNTSKPLPQWLSEGFAEFMASPVFGADGSIGIGAPPEYRASQLFQGRQVPLSNLVSNRVDTDYDMISFYTQGWLLTHYLSMEPSRKGQIDKYVAQIDSGVPPLEAAKASFGDLGQLEKTLLAYRRQKQLPFIKINSAKLSIAPVTVTEMSRGAQESMPYRIRIKAAFADVGSDLVSRVRAIADKYPKDGFVLRTLAEAQYKAKDYDAAVKTAQQAVAADPKSVEALTLEGEALLKAAKKSNNVQSFQDARRLFLTANRLDKEDPEPLYYYYRTYIEAGAQVPQSAKDAVHYAAVLAPQDPEVQVRSTIQFLRDGKPEDAKAQLSGLAFSPHHNKGQRLANEIYDLINANKRDEAIALAEKELIKVTEDDD